MLYRMVSTDFFTFFFTLDQKMKITMLSNKNENPPIMDICTLYECLIIWHNNIKSTNQALSHYKNMYFSNAIIHLYVCVLFSFSASSTNGQVFQSFLRNIWDAACTFLIQLWTTLTIIIGTETCDSLTRDCRTSINQHRMTFQERRDGSIEDL